MNERHVECLLQVAGDTIILNTFAPARAELPAREMKWGSPYDVF